MVGIRKIAKEAGVSPATVSRVLNNDESFSVSTNTRAIIKKVAKKYHYQPRVNKQITPRQVERNILVITTHSLEAESHDPYFAQVHDGIIQEASRHQIHIKDFIRFPDASFDFTKAADYDGIIIAGVFTKNFYHQLARYNTKLVLIDEYRYLPEYDIIRNSYFDETQLILDRLYANGLSKIAFIGGPIKPMTTDGPSNDSYQDIRTSAYESWMTTHHLTPNTAISGWLPKDGFVAMNDLLRSSTPDVVLIASDQLAVGAYRAITQHQQNIPNDIQIISYNDSNIAAYLVPSLTSVNPNSLNMGKLAVKTLMDRIQHTDRLPIHVSLPASVTCRESSLINLTK